MQYSSFLTMYNDIIHSWSIMINNMSCIFIGPSGKVTVETIYKREPYPFGRIPSAYDNNNFLTTAVKAELLR